MREEQMENPEGTSTKRQEVPRGMQELPEFVHALTALFEPEPLQNDLAVALRAVSTVAGYNTRCPRQSCRGDGSCRAEEVTARGSPCLFFWTPQQRICFDAVIATLTRSHIRTAQLRMTIRAALDQWYEDNLPEID